MARAMEFTVTILDKPGALGKCFLALAERGVNVLAFQSYVEERESLTRFVVDDPATKRRFCRALMAKYGKAEWDRPKDFFPRIDLITVYAIKIERLTGKQTPLPSVTEQWPALDRTKSPNATP